MIRGPYTNPINRPDFYEKQFEKVVRYVYFLLVLNLLLIATVVYLYIASGGYDYYVNMSGGNLIQIYGQ